MPKHCMSSPRYSSHKDLETPSPPFLVMQVIIIISIDAEIRLLTIRRGQPHIRGIFLEKSAVADIRGVYNIADGFSAVAG